MKKLPKRPISHILEEDSLKFVKRTFPKEWIVEEIKNDYGVDLELEIVENEEVTGAHFLIQLKSSNSLVINKKGFISHSCKTSTLQYFLERPELFIYLVYDSINDIGYWIWIQDFLRAQPSPDWKKQQTFTIKIPKDNVLNNLSIESIKKRVLKNHEKGKLINTIETLDHPGIRYGVEFNENTTVISAYSKYPGAELDYPLNFGLTLNFDESEEGKKTKKAWEDAFKKGTSAEIKAPF
ncbi:MAG TPA: hypothetical protein DHW49_05545, partial [Anaerolineae bacterium]|nr:hypothetical protein [Anaerolineae bacterium]